MCHRLHDASIANDAMQRIYDPDSNDVARIKRLRKKISREQKLLAFWLLRQSKKKTRPHNNEYKSEEEEIDGMGMDNEFETEEEEIDDMGMDNEFESEEEQIDVGGVDAVFENREDNHLEEAEAGGEKEFQSHEDGINNKVDEDETQMDEGCTDVESLGGNKLDAKKVQMERPGSKRDKWTAAEINYVQQWIRLYPYRPVGELYRHVLDDAHAVKHIFHWRHIASVGMLDYMYKKCHKGFKV